ncbi:MAG: hypothetical protein AB8B72_09035 [Crocinitomicaceae bacterium]
MKLATIIAFCLSVTFAHSANFDIKRMRELFQLVDKDEKYYNELDELTKESTHHQPIAFGYRALYYFMKAKYVMWPNQKMAAFNMGKKMIEALVTLNPKEPELRIIRYSVQYNVPSILGYSSNLVEDKKVMQSALKVSKFKPIHYLITGVLNLYK